MIPKRVTHAMEDYLKEIFLLEEEGEEARAGALASRLHVSVPSATNMLKRLERLSLVHRVPYRGVVLTPEGRLIALEIVRHHRLLELYLFKALGIPWESVHREAEALEHVLSEELEEAISRSLAHPRRDPHGHPIPSRRLRYPSRTLRRLSALLPGDRARVEHLSDRAPVALRRLGRLGVVPGAHLTVEGRDKEGVRIHLKNRSTRIPPPLVPLIWVRMVGKGRRRSRNP